MTLRNICAGTTWTSSMSSSPHSLPLMFSMTSCALSDLRPLKLIIVYVVMSTTGRPGTRSSFRSLVKTHMFSSGIVVQSWNWYFHCRTETALVQRQTTDFLMVWAAVTPVSVLPAPQGRTMMPERARPLPNIWVIHTAMDQDGCKHLIDQR